MNDVKPFLFLPVKASEKSTSVTTTSTGVDSSGQTGSCVVSHLGQHDAAQI